MKEMIKNVISFEEHPLVAHKLTKLRDINTGSKEFSEIITELTIMMGYGALEDLKLRNERIEAPLTVMDSPVLDDTITIVPILRAGLGMVEGLRTLIPNARVGYVGMYRDQTTLKPITYYYKMPVNAESHPAVVMDPALATGGTVLETINKLKSEGYENIRVMSVFASKTGCDLIHDKYPNIKIYCAQYCPDKLNDDGFIITAAGDIGDRLNGTYGYKKAKQSKA